MRATFPLSALLAVALTTGDARAAGCAAIAGGSTSLERIDAGERLRFVRERLRVDARDARIWAWTWAGIYSALTVGNLALLAAHDQDQRRDDYLGAAASFVGLAVLLVSPLKVMRDQRWLERRLARAPAGVDPCALLADAERLLIRDAAAEAFGKGPLVHAGAFIFNLGLGLVLGAGFGHWNSAAITSLVGIAISEIQIVSQPNGALRTLQRYRRANLGPPARWRPYHLGLAPIAGPDHIGLMIGGAF